MTRQSELQHLAGDILEDIQARASEAKKELLQIKTREALIDAQLEAAKVALDRFPRFQFEIGGKLQCPRCWIAEGINEAVIAVASDDGRIDRFRCRRCDYSFELFV